MQVYVQLKSLVLVQVQSQVHVQCKSRCSAGVNKGKGCSGAGIGIGTEFRKVKVLWFINQWYNTRPYAKAAVRISHYVQL